jgi:hypothetical protein
VQRKEEALSNLPLLANDLIFASSRSRPREFDCLHEMGAKRRFLENEAELAPFSESGHLAGNAQGFQSLEETKQAGEKDAEAMEDAL